MSVISIPLQAGGPEDGGIRRIKVDLFKELQKICQSTYCKAVDQYEPVIRVDGTIHKFGDEGITRLRFAKKQRYITADIQIPESVWLPKTKNEIRNYIADKVRESIRMFVDRLKKEKFEVNELALFAEIDKAIENFKKHDYEGAC